MTAKTRRTSPDQPAAMRPARRSSGKAVAAGRGEDEPFPPPSTSLEAFLIDGSDRQFRNLIYKLLSTSTLMLRARERFASHIGVSGPQYSMMVVIAESTTATVGQIAAQLRVTSPFVTVEVGKLIAKGILARSPHKEDRRSSLLTLTQKGKDLIRDVAPLRCFTNDMIFGSLTREQATALNDIMDTLLLESEQALYAINAPNWRKKQQALS